MPPAPSGASRRMKLRKQLRRATGRAATADRRSSRPQPCMPTAPVGRQHGRVARRGCGGFPDSRSPRWNRMGLPARSLCGYQSAVHAGGPPFVSGNQGPDYRIELGFGLVRWVDQHEARAARRGGSWPLSCCYTRLCSSYGDACAPGRSTRAARRLRPVNDSRRAPARSVGRRSSFRR